MPIEEGVAIYLGDLEVEIRYWLAIPPAGTTGAKSNSTTSGDSGMKASQIVDELIGKIGAAIGPYDPESSDRMIQEF